MIKVLAIGDPHFKVDNVQESDMMTDNLINLARKIEPNIIICLGDILHKHEKIHVKPLMAAENFIKKLSIVAPTYLIIGNHDRPNNSNYLTTEHPFNPLKEWNNTYIIDTTTTITLNNENNDYKFVLVPYVPPGRFIEALETIENPLEKTRAIFAHQEFYMAKMGAICSQAGDKWPEENPLVISGHVHDYDRLQSNIIYTGTPMQHAFGDKSDKTVSEYIFKATGEWEEIRHDLGLIKRVIVYLHPQQVQTYIPPENKLVKIVIKGEDSEIKPLLHSLKIKELRSKGVKVAFKTTGSFNLSDYNNKNNLLESFSKRLYNQIKNSPEMLIEFNNLFH